MFLEGFLLISMLGFVLASLYSLYSCGFLLGSHESNRKDCDQLIESLKENTDSVRELLAFIQDGSTPPSRK